MICQTITRNEMMVMLVLMIAWAFVLVYEIAINLGMDKAIWDEPHLQSSEIIRLVADGFALYVILSISRTFSILPC